MKGNNQSYFSIENVKSLYQKIEESMDSSSQEIPVTVVATPQSKIVKNTVRNYGPDYSLDELHFLHTCNDLGNFSPPPSSVSADLPAKSIPVSTKPGNGKRKLNEETAQPKTCIDLETSPPVSPASPSINDAKWSAPGVRSGQGLATMKPASYIPEAVVGLAPLGYEKDDSVVRAGIRGQSKLTFNTKAAIPVPVSSPAPAPVPVKRGQQIITFGSASTMNKENINMRQLQPQPQPQPQPQVNVQVQRSQLQHVQTTSPPQTTVPAPVQSQSSTQAHASPSPSLNPLPESIQNTTGLLEVVKRSGCTVRNNSDMDDSFRLCCIKDYGISLLYNAIVKTTAIPEDDVIETLRYRILLNVNDLTYYQNQPECRESVDIPVESLDFATKQGRIEWAAPGWLYGWVSATGRLVNDSAVITKVVKNMPLQVQVPAQLPQNDDDAPNQSQFAMRNMLHPLASMGVQLPHQQQSNQQYQHQHQHQHQNQRPAISMQHTAQPKNLYSLGATVTRHSRPNHHQSNISTAPEHHQL